MFDKQQQALIAINNHKEIYLLPSMANRHGLITGATGTGKTVSLQMLAETFSQMGVPVFAADVKGDLSGLAAPGGNNQGVDKRVKAYRLSDKGFAYQSFPVQFWDVLGQSGAPLRATMEDMGAHLLSRLLSLNETQSSLLSVIFKIAQDEKLPLIDVKDMTKLLEYAALRQAELMPVYGNIPSSSLGAIQRNLLALANEGGELFFGQPSLDINDLLRTQGNLGVINILAADKLMNSPRLYTTFLVWLLDMLFKNLPETGDTATPRLVFFFDEAHLLFSDASKLLLQKIEQTVRLIRSKGVGVFFISQSPADIPENVLGQLGNKIQHALRAYTPKDQKNLKAAAQAFRANPEFNTEQAIAALEIGEALVSMLDAKGTPQMVERAFICPPQGQIGMLDEAARQSILKASLPYRYYAKATDEASAYEMLSEKIKDSTSPAEHKAQEKARREEEKQRQTLKKQEERATRERTRFWRTVVKSTVVPLAREFLRSLFKK